MNTEGMLCRKLGVWWTNRSPFVDMEAAVTLNTPEQTEPLMIDQIRERVCGD